MRGFRADSPRSVGRVSREQPDEEKARLFVALDLPDDVRAGIAAWQAKALGDPALRPMRAEALHVTLCFLAHRAEARYPAGRGGHPLARAAPARASLRPRALAGAEGPAAALHPERVGRQRRRVPGGAGQGARRRAPLRARGAALLAARDRRAGAQRAARARAGQAARKGAPEARSRAPGSAAKGTRQSPSVPSESLSTVRISSPREPSTIALSGVDLPSPEDQKR